MVITHSSGTHISRSLFSQNALVLSGGSLTFSNTFQVNNGLILSGGTLRSATVLPGTGGQGIVASGTGGTLDGVTLNGEMDVGRLNNGASVRIINGMVLNGTIHLGNPSNSWWGQLGFTGTQTLNGTGTVVFGNQGACNAMRLDTAATTLTIAPGITVRGHSGQIGQSTSCVGTPANVTVINQGIISADVSGGAIITRGQELINQGVLESRNGGHLSVQNLVGNVGEVSLVAGSTLTLNGNYTNNVALDMTTNAVLNLNGTWVNTAMINATNATVNLGGNFTLGGLGLLNRTGGRINLTGTLDADGGTVNLNAASGSWWMSGGTLRNAVVNQSDDALLNWGTGTLDGVTVNGDLDVGRQDSGAVMTVRNGLVLNGTLYLGNATNSWWGQAGFIGTQTLSGNATVIFGNQGACNALRVDTAGTTLTLAPTVTLRGHSGQIGQSTSCVGTPANVTVINQGIISADVSGGTIFTRGQELINQGMLESRNGGHLNVQNLTGNAGQISLLGGSTLTLNGSYTNNLVMNIAANAVLNLAGNWANTGSINATNATVNLGGSFNLSDVGEFNRSGGAVNLTGTLDAAGGTVVLDADSGSWFMNGGTLRNAVLSASGGAELIFGSGTLEGVTVNGDLDVGRRDNGAVLTVRNGLVLNGTLHLGNPANNWWGQVAFVGTQTLGGGGTVLFGNQGACNALRVETAGTTLTIGPDITVHGHSGQIGQSTSCIGSPANVSVVNQGLIAADTSGGTISIRAQSFTNEAAVEVVSGAVLLIDRLQNAADGDVLASGGTLTLNGSWNNDGLIQVTNATVNIGGSSTEVGSFSALDSALNITGTYTTAQIESIQYSPGRVRLIGGLVDNTDHTLALNAGTGSWFISSGTFRNGVVSGSGAAQLIFAGGILDGVTVNGDLDIGRQDNGANVQIHNGLALNGTMYLGNPTNNWWGQVSFVGTQTLSGIGTVVFGNQGACNAIRLETGGTALTLGPGITVRGHSGQIGHSTSCIGSAANVTVINQGVIASEVSAGTIYLRAQSFINEGEIDARSGTIHFITPPSLAEGVLSVGITSASANGRITFNNPATLEGTIRAHFNGVYRPESGTSFTLLTYPSRTGSFAAFDLPADVQWQTTNGPTAFSITGTALLELPSIVVGPQTQSIVVGSPATFTVSALGTQPLGYIWQKNGVDLTDNARMGGERSASFTITNVIATDVGAYRVVVTNEFGSVTSAVATLTPLCVIAASSNPAESGNIVGIGVFAAGGTNVLTANARTGYRFSNWTEGGAVVGTNTTLTTILASNHVYVANFVEANPLHTVTTATLPADLASLEGAGTYSNGQSFSFSAPLSITNPPNLFNFREWRANGALVSGSADFTKTFSTLDPTNVQFVAHYNAMTILPLVTNVTLNFAQPVPVTTNFQLSVHFNRSMDTNFTPLIVLTNVAAGSVQPDVASGGRWTTVAGLNDTFTPPPITLSAGMDGTNQIFVSLARDLAGSEMNLTNVLGVRVDVTAPAGPALTLVSSNSSAATVSWASYAAPADVASYRVYLVTSNFTSVGGQIPVSGVGSGTRQFTFGGLALDQQYYAAVAAVDTAGNSSQTVTPLVFSLPSTTPPPVAVQAQAIGPSSANVTWNGYNTSALLGFAGFKLYYETTSFASVNGLTAKQTLAPGVRSIRVDNLDRTRVYYFAIVGFNGINGFNPNVTTATWSDPLAGDIGVSMTIGGAGEVVEILQDINVVNNAVLTVARGTTVRFASGTSLSIQQGALNANGTALEPIIFTSSKDQAGETPTAGDWDGITLASGAGASVLRHVFVNYATDFTISDCSPTLDAFSAFYNRSAGINLLGTGAVNTADALLAFNGFGVQQFNTAQANLRGSVIKNNGTNAWGGGASTLIATQIWWGSAIAGDIDGTLRGSVVRTSFLTGEPLLTPAIGTSNNITQTGSRILNLRLACRTAEAMRLSEDSTFAGVFYTPFTNATSFQLSEGGGTKTVFAQFRSITGQTSAPVSVAITYITAGPTIGNFSLTEGQVLTRPVLVTGSASAPLGMVAMEFYLDNVGVATNLGGGFSYAFDLRNISPGVHRVKLLARDNAGNFATLERNVLISPVPPPAPSITDPANDISVGTNAIRVAGSAEPLVEVRLFRAGTLLGTTNASGAGTFSFAGVPLVEGLNPLSVVAIDPLGNAGSPIRTVVRDTVPPAALILDPPVYHFGSGLTLTWRFAPTGKRATSFQVLWHTAPITQTNQASGRSLRTPGSQTTIQGLATANYYFYIVGFDDIGNVSPLSAPVQFLFDAALPSFTISFDKPSPVGAGPLRVTIASSKPINGLPSATIKLNGSSPALLPLTNTAINSFEGLINVGPTFPSGPVAFNVSAVDTIGNPFNGSPLGAPLVIDLRPPAGAITTSPIAPVQATNNTLVTLNLRLTEEPKTGTTPELNFGPPLGASVPITLTGAGTNWNGTFTVTPEMGSGVGHFTFTANDELDNVGHSITSGSALEIYNTGLPSPPGQPVGFQVESLAGGRVQLTWNSVSNAEIYRVYAATGTNLVAPTTLVADDITTNNYVHLPATDGPYRYVVTALRRSSEGTNSIVRVALSDRTAPSAPTQLALEMVAAGLRLSWQPGAGEIADRYLVYRNGSLIRTVSGATTAIIDTPTRGVMNYTVAASDPLGNEALSQAATIELLVGAVANLQALVNVGAAPRLSWVSSDPTAVAFNVYRNGIKQNNTPVTGTNFTDVLPTAGAAVTYAVRALNTTNAESAARTVTVYGVDLRLSVNETVEGVRPPTGRYFDKYQVTVANVTTGGVLPLRQMEVRRTSTAEPLNLVTIAGTPVNAGDTWVRDLSIPCAADNSAQVVRLRAIQETDAGGSSVIYERTFDFPTVEAPGVMLEVSANQLPLAGGLNSFDVRIYNRGYATMYFAAARGNGADPGDLAIIVRNPQGQEVSRQAFTGTPAGTVFSGGVGYVPVAPGASLALTVPSVLVPEALAGDVVTFEAEVSSIYDRFSADGQLRSGPLSGSMESSLSQTPYFGTAQTDSPTYGNEEPVIITGQALDRITSAPRANVPLKIGFATRGYRWYRDVTTDASGNYSYTYNPGPGLAGSLTIWAAHPDVVDQLNQARITIYRLYANPAAGDVRMSKNDTLDFSITLFNPGDQALGDFTVSAEVFELQGTNQTTTTKIAGSLLSDDDFTIAAGQRRTINLRLAAAADAPNNAIVVFTFTSTEGAVAKFTANVTLLPAVPVIAVTSPEVGYVELSVDRGGLISRSITIVNSGLKDLQGVTLTPPTNQTWMVLNLGRNTNGTISLPDLMVGGSNTFTVVFAPPTDTALGFHQDKIVVRGTNTTATFDVNLYARVTSDQLGAVQFYVDNILGADVPNATVRLRNTALQIELPSVQTDINGLVNVTNLQEGDWSWQVNAPGHSANVGVVQVIASQTVQVATRLNKSVVTINFSVVPVPFTDRYEIRLEQTFETHVPMPVLVMSPAFMQFDNVKPGFEASYIVTAKNEGLIQMENLTIKGSQSATATFTPLITYAPFLLPQQTIEIPVHVTYSGSAGQSQQSNPLADCLPNPLGFLDDIGPFTDGLAALANAEGRCIKDNTLLMCAGAFAMGMKIFGDVTSVLSSVAEQAASYIGCVLGSLLSNFGGGFGGGGGGGPSQESVQNFVQGGSVCFAAETPVLMADGSSKPINQIKVGDLVKTGKESANVAHVAEVFELTSNTLRDLEFTRHGDGSNSLRTTDEHLFWLDGKGWVEAHALRVGEWLLDDQSRPVQITKTQRAPGREQVYTIRLREDAAFYANGILVHDMCGLVTAEVGAAESFPTSPPERRPVLFKEGASK